MISQMAASMVSRVSEH